MALGADGRRVLRLVMGQAVLTTGVGPGHWPAWAPSSVTRLMTGLLFDVRPADPVALAGALAVLGVVAFVASWLPGRAAASIEPLQAMRTD